MYYIYINEIAFDHNDVYFWLNISKMIWQKSAKEATKIIKEFETRFLQGKAILVGTFQFIKIWLPWAMYDRGL